LRLGGSMSARTKAAAEDAAAAWDAWIRAEARAVVPE
jgi:hypothetical protein